MTALTLNSIARAQKTVVCGILDREMKAAPDIWLHIRLNRRTFDKYKQPYFDIVVQFCRVSMTNKFRKSNSSDGLAVVEVAVTLPILVLVAFAAIEVCNMISLQQVTFRAAYDATREISLRNLTNDQAIDFAKERLANGDIVAEFRITTEPTELEEFEQVHLTISASCDDAFSFVNLLRGRATTIRATAVRWVDAPPQPTPVNVGRRRGNSDNARGKRQN